MACIIVLNVMDESHFVAKFFCEPAIQLRQKKTHRPNMPKRTMDRSSRSFYTGSASLFFSSATAIQCSAFRASSRLNKETWFFINCTELETATLNNSNMAPLIACRKCYRGLTSLASYVHRRTFVAVMREISECLGLSRMTQSSGTMADGTTNTADLLDTAHWLPKPTLALPAGQASHPVSSDCTVAIVRAFHTFSGMSIATRKRYSGRPPTSR
ncbi:MAG: hypothetical protein NUV75_04590 [Gallionella sp.]|nr:hypothetical protein [Gallionella sp.]